MVSMEEWYEEKVAAPKREKQYVSLQAIQTKLRNKMSKRDIERELRIKNLGGNSLEVQYGIPLKEEERKVRLELEWDLKYPKRKEKRSPKKRSPKGFTPKKGSKRSEQQFIYGILHGAKVRAKASNVPFNLELSDLSVPKLCPVLKIPLMWGEKLTNNTPSIDRLVPDKGYVKGNCTIISMKANRLKNNASKEELIAILEYISNKEKLSSA